MQLALYRMRAAYERETFAWPDTPELPGRAGSSGSLHSGSRPPAQGHPQQTDGENKIEITRLLDQDAQARRSNQLDGQAGNRPRGVDRVGAGFRPTTTISDEYGRKVSTLKLKKVKTHPT